MSIGLRAYGVGPAYRHGIRHSGALIGVPFTIVVPCVSGTSTYTIYSNDAPKRFRVINAHGVMTGAGAAADTAVIDDGSNNITDTADLSAMGNNDIFDFSEIDDSQHQIDKGGSLRVVTASDATCIIYIHCVWLE